MPPKPPQRRSVAIALLACLGLRWGIAAVTEREPIFPIYYYTDALRIDKNARQIVAAWRSGSDLRPPTGSGGDHLYTLWVARIYHLAGPHPILPKLFNGMAATVGVYAWHRIAFLACGSGPALAMLWLLTLWPSHAFFSTQNTKDPLLILLVSLVLYAFLSGWRQSENPAGNRRVQTRWALGSAVLLGAGLLRAYTIPLLAAPLLAAGAITALRKRGDSWMAWGGLAIWLIGAASLFGPVSQLLFGRLLAARSFDNPTAPMALAPTATLIPKTTRPDGTSGAVSPLSPRGLSEFRRIRHSEDRFFARKFMGREIGTQIFPEAEFKNWGDVALFLPKGAFYALFMPLPGLYPMDESLGRTLAALENAALLALALLSLAGWLSSAKTQASWTLFFFFLASSAAYGLLEFDLGAAARHRLQYLPCLFPFSMLWLHSLLRPDKSGADSRKATMAWGDGAERIPS